MNELSHISEEQSEAFSLNRLGPVETDIVEDHLLLCEFCRHQISELEEFHAILRAALRQTSDSLRQTRYKITVTGELTQPLGILPHSLYFVVSYRTVQGGADFLVYPVRQARFRAHKVVYITQYKSALSNVPATR